MAKSLLQLTRQLNTKDTQTLRMNRAAFSFNVKEMKDILENHPDWEMMSLPIRLVQGTRSSKKKTVFTPIFIEVDHRALEAKDNKC